MAPFSLFVGLRYTGAKRRNHFISFISLVSVIGIALGVTVLITVLSVMNGFDEELKERILGFAPHVSLYGYGGDLNDWQPLQQQLSNMPGVIESTPFVEGQGLLTHANLNRYGMVQGIEPTSPSQARLAQQMVDGRLTDLKAGEFGIVLGKRLAQLLAVDLGDKVTVVVPKASFTPAGILPRLKRFTVVGTFEIGYSYDNSLAFIHLADAQKLFQLRNNAVSGIHLKLDNLYAAIGFSKQLAKKLNYQYAVTNWTRTNGNFFEAVKMEKTLMFILLLLIVLVAAFNILATLIMLVTEKKADIAILRTLGASPGMIMRIFFVQGSIIGTVGTVLGLCGGLALASHVTELVELLEQVLHRKLLSADVYYISYLPSSIHSQDVIVVALAALLMSFLFTLYPAYKASKTVPAEALRYE